MEMRRVVLYTAFLSLFLLTSVKLIAEMIYRLGILKRHWMLLLGLFNLILKMGRHGIILLVCKLSSPYFVLHVLSEYSSFLLFVSSSLNIVIIFWVFFFFFCFWLHWVPKPIWAFELYFTYILILELDFLILMGVSAMSMKKV